MRAVALAALVLCACSPRVLTGPPAVEAFPQSVENAVGAYTDAGGRVSLGCREVVGSMQVILLPRHRTEALCRTRFRDGVGACHGLFANGWRAYIAEDNFNVAGSVDHEIRHLLPLCEGHPLGNDYFHCGAWWPPGTTCGDP